MNEYQSFTMQDFESDGEPMLTKIDYLTDMFDLEAQNEHGKPVVITLREKDRHFAERQAPEVTIELNNCPTHGAVNADHGCPEFDGVLRDAWTGDTLDDSSFPDRSHKRDASIKHLGMTENGTQYRP